VILLKINFKWIQYSFKYLQGGKVDVTVADREVESLSTEHRRNKYKLYKRI